MTPSYTLFASPKISEESLLQLWIKELSAKVLEAEKVRLKARNLDEDQVELVLHDKQQLQLELEKLKRLQVKIKMELFGMKNLFNQNLTGRLGLNISINR